jgi:iron(III) transport system ATP-binding protein
MVYVTHDQAEALSLADRLVVMDGGRIVQTGTPEEVYRHPRTGFVARALGATNLLPARVTSTTTGGEIGLRMPGGVAVVAARPAEGAVREGSDVTVSVRPGDLRLIPAPDGTPEAPRVREALFFGDHVQYAVDVPGLPAAVKATGPSAGRLEPGTPVVLDVPGSAVAVVADPVDAAVPSAVPAPQAPAAGLSAA